jgi:hypothetical protein
MYYSAVLKDSENVPLTIPDVFFKPLADGKISRTDYYTSPVSGRTIRFYRSSNHIEIRDEKLPDSYFVKMRSDHGMLTAYVRTKGWQGKSQRKHPDLFATQLLLKEFTYLKESGNNPQSFLAQWKSTGDLTDNFDTFKQALRKTGVDWKRFPPESKTVIDNEHELFLVFEQAVRSTWTWGFVQKIADNPKLERVSINRVPWSPDPYGFDPEPAYDFVYAKILLDARVR